MKEGCSLVDISWHVPDGYLVAVVGAVGTGKSSLLSGIMLIQIWSFSYVCIKMSNYPHKMQIFRMALKCIHF